VRALVDRRVDARCSRAGAGRGVVPAGGYRPRPVVVSLDRPVEGVDVDTVIVDNRSATTEAVRELIHAGHRRIALLADNSSLWTMQERALGYRLALAEAGIEQDPVLVHLDCPTAEATQDAIAVLLSTDDPPTAVFAAHNATGRELVRRRAAAIDLPLVVFDEMSDSTCDRAAAGPALESRPARDDSSRDGARAPGRAHGPVACRDPARLARHAGFVGGGVSSTLPILLGLDVGTTQGQAVAVGLDGTSSPTSTTRPPGSSAARDRDGSGRARERHPRGRL
jgi:hypothetical protein